MAVRLFCGNAPLLAALLLASAEGAQVQGQRRSCQPTPSRRLANSSFEQSPKSTVSYQYFCKHNRRHSSFYINCNTCRSRPICCDALSAQSSSRRGSGGLRCTRRKSVDLQKCTKVLPYPFACPSQPTRKSFQWFCKRNRGERSYYVSCDQCHGTPICCDALTAQRSSRSRSGGRRCTRRDRVDDRMCSSQPKPASCVKCRKTCHAGRFLFPTNVTQVTGKSLPVWYDKELGNPDRRNEDVRTIIVVQHGFSRNGKEYLCFMANAVRQQLSRQNRQRVLVVAPQFFHRGDPRSSGMLLWPKPRWAPGGLSVGKGSHRISSYAAYDQLLLLLARSGGNFPNLQRIKLVGFSAGGQLMQRYAAFGQAYEQIRGSRPSVAVEFFVGSPSSLVYFDERRPVLDVDALCATGGYCETPVVRNAQFTFAVPRRSACQDTYNIYKFGIAGGLNPYLSSVDVQAGIRAFGRKKITYLAGSLDTCNKNRKAFPCQRSQRHCRHSAVSSCEANLQGACRYMRLHAWFQYASLFFGTSGSSSIHDIRAGHSVCKVFQSERGRRLIVGTDRDF